MIVPPYQRITDPHKLVLGKRHMMKCGEDLALPLKGVCCQPEGVTFVDLLKPGPLLDISNDQFKAVVLLSEGVLSMDGSCAIRLGQNHVTPNFA